MLNLPLRARRAWALVSIPIRAADMNGPSSTSGTVTPMYSGRARLWSVAPPRAGRSAIIRRRGTHRSGPSLGALALAKGKSVRGLAGSHGGTVSNLQEEWDELAGHLDGGTVAEKAGISEEVERAHCRKQKHLGDQRTEAAESKHGPSRLR